MRRLAIVVVVLLALAGCSDSHDSTVDEQSTGATADLPEAYARLLAQLPAFDEPASADVTAYRIAVFGARSARCAHRSGGADRAAFLRANAKVLDFAGTVRGARLVSELAVPHTDGNGCPEGSGPPTSFTTDRVYRLRAGTRAAAVFAYYERVLHYGWLETSGNAPCQRSFGQAAAFLLVDACAGSLRLEALGKAPLVAAAADRLPPRPFGLEYPAAADQPSPAEPTSEEIESGQTCERGVGVEVPSVILPPPPGLTAEVTRGTVVVHWSFERILGDCPPRRILLTVQGSNANGSQYAANVDVHERSGTAELRLPAALRDASVLRAATESVDGTRSRLVAVLIRRRT
jgi:hypothetical protein